MKTNKLELIGKRWLDRLNGNTYFSAVAIFNGEAIKKIDFSYGYGDQWLAELTRDLVVGQYQRGDTQQHWQFINQLEEYGIAVFTACHDVKRKKDL